MSTKNLARTVIEGGRAPRNRWERRRSNAVERRREAQASARLRLAIEPEEISYQPRTKVHAEFRDRLGPAWRWLEAQVGRPWSNVQSELIQRFDTRTTAGRHIAGRLLDQAPVHPVVTTPGVVYLGRCRAGTEFGKQSRC